MAIFDDVINTHQQSFLNNEHQNPSYVKKVNRIMLNHVNIISIIDRKSFFGIPRTIRGSL